jgi:hypothetical protein
MVLAEVPDPTGTTYQNQCEEVQRVIGKRKQADESAMETETSR